MNQPLDITEQLATFLAGELDDDAAAAVQARIDSEPWVAQLADQMADMLMGLGQVDDVEPAPGFEDRLRAAVAAEVGTPVADLVPDTASLSSAAAAATGWVQSDAESMARQRARRRSQGRFLAVAAAFTLVAVAAVGTLTNSGFGGGDTETAVDAADDAAEFEDRSAGEDESSFAAAEEAGVADEAMDEGAMEEDAAEADALVEQEAMAEEDAADEGRQAAADADEAMDDEAMDEEETADEPAAAPGPDTPLPGPELLTLGPVTGGDAELRTLVADSPAAIALLGTPVAQVGEIAAAYRDEILRSDPYGDGTPASTCVLDVLSEADGELVPAVAARVDRPTVGPAIAFALVRSADGAVLDRIDVHVVGAADCQLQQVLGG